MNKKFMFFAKKLKKQLIYIFQKKLKNFFGQIKRNGKILIFGKEIIENTINFPFFENSSKNY